MEERKTKVKELVGKGISSYHANVKQQIDRIERKNKEQNHKISILTNELDNDYLTKTEEGSVISLEHSKEGMVYIDSLEGNTLVNYCTDGVKEMTLNGDIDLEGTFVTTTEGVDSGLVDVMCEGSTLVNLVESISSFIGTPLYSTVKLSYNLVKDTKYTIMFYNVSNKATTFTLTNGLGTMLFPYVNISEKYCFTMGDISIGRLYIQGNETLTSDDLINLKIMILEGDWTEKEIPPYFEGMKSVGQDDTNGHGIEILSNNKNFLVSGFERGNIDSNGNLFNQASYMRSVDYEYCIPNTEIIASYNGLFRFSQFFFFDKNKEFISKQTTNKVTVPSDARYFKLVIAKVDATEVTDGDVNGYANKTTMVRITSQSVDYIAPKLNKKEIPLSEPLRGLPNGVKDRFIKIGGKWYVERNCGETVLNGSDDEKWYIDGSYSKYSSTKTRFRFDINFGYISNMTNFICDNYKIKLNSEWVKDTEGIEFGKIDLGITISNDKLPVCDVDNFKQWLRNNPATVVYQLVTPIYEPLHLSPELIIYLDTTHISNNSVVPCNMKVKNTGYNAIIKPSTLYTVALDTNKTGTIGMNLGGVKATTTTNVLTLTTPATLEDDSLRLYGKGLKGGNIRLLEGNKTNWIPSYFEGMKSSFEDRVQEDGSYRIEISSNNKNLLDIEKITKPDGTKAPFVDGYYHLISNWSEYQTLDEPIYIKKDEYYTLTVEGFKSGGYCNFIFGNNVTYLIQETYGLVFSSMLSNNETIIKKTVQAKRDMCINSVLYDCDNAGHSWYIKNIQLEKNNGATDFMQSKSNKIQFSSIEPLRGVGNIKDKFVFKDGKLMIERNCKELRCTSNNLILEGVHGANTRFYYDVRTFGFETGTKPLAIQGLKEVCYYDKNYSSRMSSYLPCYGYDKDWGGWQIGVYMPNDTVKSLEDAKIWLDNNIITSVWKLEEPTYEEIPYELQKIILEGYENGTLFIDTNIPPTVTTTYAGQAPIVAAAKETKNAVSGVTSDINEVIVPYLMDMDYRIVTLQLQNEEVSTINTYKLLGSTYDMIKRDILSKRYSSIEYLNRMSDYHSLGRITDSELDELKQIIAEVFSNEQN